MAVPEANAEVTRAAGPASNSSDDDKTMRLGGFVCDYNRFITRQTNSR